jgi:glycosyltransferase involved in cell wall biosynthesis
LLADTEARLAMGKKARERARNFDWQSSAARFERLILTD